MGASPMIIGLLIYCCLFWMVAIGLGIAGAAGAFSPTPTDAPVVEPVDIVTTTTAPGGSSGDPGTTTTAPGGSSGSPGTTTTTASGGSYTSMGLGVSCRSIPNGPYLASDFSADSPITGISLDDCQIKCDDTTGCYGVNYLDDKPTTNTGLSGKCSLFIGSKNILGGAGAETCYYSSKATAPLLNTYTALTKNKTCSSVDGVKRSRSDFLTGNNLLGSTLDACKRYCSFTPDCGAITYFDNSPSLDGGWGVCQLQKKNVIFTGIDGMTDFRDKTPQCHVKGS